KTQRARSYTETLFQQRSYFAAKIISAALEAFTHLVARESPDRDTLAGLGDLFCHQLADSLCWIFHERLIEQNRLLIKLVQPTFNDLVDHLLGFVGVLRLVLRLRSGDLALLLEHPRGNFFTRNVARLG